MLTSLLVINIVRAVPQDKHSLLSLIRSVMSLPSSWQHDLHQFKHLHTTAGRAAHTWCCQRNRVCSETFYMHVHQSAQEEWGTQRDTRQSSLFVFPLTLNWSFPRKHSLLINSLHTCSSSTQNPSKQASKGTVLQCISQIFVNISLHKFRAIWPSWKVHKRTYVQTFSNQTLNLVHVGPIQTEKETKCVGGNAHWLYHHNMSLQFWGGASCKVAGDAIPVE